jgi:hypothetical protein
VSPDRPGRERLRGTSRIGSLYSSRIQDISATTIIVTTKQHQDQRRRRQQGAWTGGKSVFLVFALGRGGLHSVTPEESLRPRYLHFLLRFCTSCVLRSANVQFQPVIWRVLSFPAARWLHPVRRLDRARTHASEIWRRTNNPAWYIAHPFLPPPPPNSIPA